jgi:hypothetical protein
VREIVAGKSRAEWDVIRPHYEDGPQTVIQLTKEFQVSKYALRRAGIAFRWRLRSPRVIDRGDVIERLFRLLDAQIFELENDMTKAGQGEVAVLGKLVGTLDKLIAIKDAESARRHPKRTTRQITDIKTKLIERIERLKRG